MVEFKSQQCLDRDIHLGLRNCSSYHLHVWIILTIILAATRSVLWMNVFCSFFLLTPLCAILKGNEVQVVKGFSSNYSNGDIILKSQETKAGSAENQHWQIISAILYLVCYMGISDPILLVSLRYSWLKEVIACRNDELGAFIHRNQ